MNTPGSYACSFPAGYEVEVDQETNQGNNLKSKKVLKKFCSGTNLMLFFLDMKLSQAVSLDVSGRVYYVLSITIICVIFINFQ